MKSVRILFFASLRESLGGQVVMQTEATTVGELRQTLMALSETHAQALGPHRLVRAAVNQTMVNDDHVFKDGQEVAFFPPVTGG